MREGERPVNAWSRKSLRLLGSVGEPINPEAWEWYHHVVGDDRCVVLRLADDATAVEIVAVIESHLVPVHARDAFPSLFFPIAPHRETNDLQFPVKMISTLTSAVLA
jgi:hypothetical protein